MTSELTRTEFWALLTEAEQQFPRELADRETGCGPLEFVAAWQSVPDDEQRERLRQLAWHELDKEIRRGG